LLGAGVLGAGAQWTETASGQDNRSGRPSSTELAERPLREISAIESRPRLSLPLSGLSGTRASHHSPASRRCIIGIYHINPFSQGRLAVQGLIKHGADAPPRPGRLRRRCRLICRRGQGLSAAQSLPPSGQCLAPQFPLAQPAVISVTGDAVATSEASAHAAHVRAPIPNSSAGRAQ
jgi:hypothetical protein